MDNWIWEKSGPPGELSRPQDWNRRQRLHRCVVMRHASGEQADAFFSERWKRLTSAS